MFEDFKKSKWIIIATHIAIFIAFGLGTMVEKVDNFKIALLFIVTVVGITTYIASQVEIYK